MVSFFDGTVLLGSSTVNASGVATYSTNALSIGSHNISAAFQANTNFNTSGASVTQVITQAVGGFTVIANSTRSRSSRAPAPPSSRSPFTSPPEHSPAR